MSGIDPSILKTKTRLVLFFGILFSLAYVFEIDSTKLIDLGIPSKSPNTVGTFYKVEKVVDGDTIKVLINGEKETIRLIGINTPETVDPRRPVECFGKEASSRMKELAEGTTVRLEYDDTQGYRDTYNRMLAYVYLEDGQMLNRKMIAEGYAYEYTYLHPYKYQDEFRKVQKLAEASKKGLWDENTCSGSKLISQ